MKYQPHYLCSYLKNNSSACSPGLFCSENHLDSIFLLVPGERTHSPISQVRISRQTDVQNRAFAKLANGLGSRIRHGIAKQRDLWEAGSGQRTWDGAETDRAKRKQGESLGGMD